MSFVSQTISALGELLRAPFQDASFLWQIAPVILLWIALEIYFGMHKSEPLGWNSALSNGVSTFWIMMSLFQVLFENDRLNFFIGGFILVTIISLYSLIIVFLAFSHKIPGSVLYSLASPEILFFSSIIAILFVHKVILFTPVMLSAIGVLFGILVLILWLLRKLLPTTQLNRYD